MIDQIGNYRIEAKIADGGVGRVFAARHALLERRVAIKLLHDHYADDPDFRRRFLREARAMAALDHPNIARIFDFGEDGGHFFLVMELIEGGSVASLMQDTGGPLDAQTAVGLVRQAAAGLAYAHNQEMIHRDIKPGNLLLDVSDSGPSFGTGTLKITDFGLVRLTDSSVVTAAGTALGTAAYMSPEQCLGQDLDLRTDIYSLGVVLFELLTGRVPFEGTSSADVAEMHVHAPPPEPKHLVPNVPDALNAITLRCLAKYPVSRYPSCDELLADLSGFVRPDDETAALLAVQAPSSASNPAAPTESIGQVDRLAEERLDGASLTISVAPEEVSGRIVGRYRVEVSTEGHRPARIELSVAAPDGGMKAFVKPRTVVVTPDAGASSRLSILTLPRFAFGPKQQPFTVSAASAGGAGAEARASFVHQPVSSSSLPFAAIGGLVVLVVCMTAGAIYAAITDTHPFGIGIEDPDGIILVADRTGAVYRFDASGELIGSWSATGADDAAFGELSAIAVDATGDLYLVDRGSHRVQKYSMEGELLATLGRPGSRPGEFDEPADASVGPDGRLYVVDRGNNRIQVFESDGVFAAEYGGLGAEPGQFDGPSGIAFDQIGNFYVADTGNNRIQKLQSFGAFLMAWGGAGSGVGGFDAPGDVAVDSEGNVYVADTGNRRIQKYDFDGRHITSWSAVDDGNPVMEFPAAIKVIEHRVYVVDTATGHVTVYYQDGSFDRAWPAPRAGPEGSVQPRDIIFVP